MRNSFLKIVIIILISSFTLFAQKDSVKLKSQNAAYFSLNELRSQLDDAFNDPNFNNAFWGVFIKSLKTGDVIYKKNQDKLFIPASLMKLFTSSSALLLLGSDFQFSTDIYIDGVIDRGVLKGDLIIRGSGDPTLSGRFTEQECTQIFVAWADSLLARGIKKIDGNIIGDDNIFDDVGLGNGWSWDLRNKWFAAPSGALSFNENLIEIEVTPTLPNFPALLSFSPETKLYTFANKVITVEDGYSEDIEVYKKNDSEIFTVMGTLKEKSQRVKVFAPVDNPTQYAVTVFQEVLETKGITLVGYAFDNDEINRDLDYTEYELLFSNTSPNLKDIIYVLNKKSNNFFAEQLLKTLGHEIYNYGTTENGVKACKELFKVMGINPENLIYADASGLSRLNLVTPKQIVNLLEYMYKSNEFNSFYESLPVAGMDGTMIDRMKKTKAEGNVRAKPGLLNGVRALSGYLKTADNEPLAFSMIVNNYLVPSNLANYIQDLVCLKLVNFSRNQ